MDEPQGPSRRIEDVAPHGESVVVHWAPQEALGWSCVSCRSTWVRQTPDESWSAAGGPLRMGTVIEVVHDAPEPVEVEERPKVPVCRSCGRADVKLDADGRVLAHGDAELGTRHCRGRGYMPRWT